ncbi:MAG: hypothetical protein Q8O31_01290 [Rhodocyclaceae bacterium]|nr:hypothetical protein [Rhodocyclaceae bacterium]
MNATTLTFRLAPSLKQEFTTATKSCNRAGAQVLRDFMHKFVEKQQKADAYDAWFRKEVQIGLDEANAGLLIPNEEVEAEAAAWRAEMLREMQDAHS